MDEYTKKAIAGQKSLAKELENEICKVYGEYIEKGIGIEASLDAIIAVLQDIACVYYRSCYVHCVGNLNIKLHDGLEEKFEQCKDYFHNQDEGVPCASDSV